MTKLLALAAATAATALAIGAGTASAGSPPVTPNGLAGALNMVNAHSSDQMFGIAMVADTQTDNGNNGMFCAVFITTGVTAPGNCS